MKYLFMFLFICSLTLAQDSTKIDSTIYKFCLEKVAEADIIINQIEETYKLQMTQWKAIKTKFEIEATEQKKKLDNNMRTQ